MQVIDFLGKFILFSKALVYVLIATINRFKTNFLSLIVIFFFSLGQCFFECLPLYAQDLVITNTDELPYSDTIDAFHNELRAINQRLRNIRLRFNHQITLTEEEMRQIVSDSDLRLALGQAQELTLELAKVLKREALHLKPSFFSLIANAGRSMVYNQLIEIGFEYLRKALDVNHKSTASRYASLLNQYLILRQYLPISSAIKQEIDGYWQHLGRLAQSSKSEIKSQYVYQYGKYLYFQDELEQSKRFFMSLLKSDYQAESEYFLAIIALRQEPESKDTLKKFQKLHEKLSIDEFYINREIQEQLEYDQIIDQSLGKFTLIDQNEQKIIEEKTKERIKKGIDIKGLDQNLKIKAVLSQTLGRLSLLAENNAQAWQYYRQIPLGFEQYQQSLLEAIYVLRKRKQYEESIPLIDQLLSQSPTDLSKLQLSLWKAEALIKSENRDMALAIYQQLEYALKEELITIQERQSKPFDQSTMAWIPLDLAEKAKSMGVQVKLEEIQYQREREKLLEIEKWAQLKKYPAIEISIKMLRELKINLKVLENRKEKVSPYWKVRLEDQEQLGEAIRILDQRIEIVIAEIEGLSLKYDQKLLKLVDQLKSEFQAIEQRIANAKSQIIDLSRYFNQVAIDTVQSYQAKLILSPTEVYFLEKEEASERIEALLAMRRFELNPILSQQNEILILGSKFEHLEELIPLIEKYREGNADYDVDFKEINRQFSSPAMDVENFNQISISDMLNLDQNIPESKPKEEPKPKEESKPKIQNSEEQELEL